MSIARWEFEHVRLFPNEIGLISSEHEWTNAQLHERARRFGSALLALGVQPGDRVAIALGNCTELFIACSGVVMAGAALVVLGDSESSELRAKIRHCDPRVILCGSRLAGMLAEAGARAKFIDVATFDDLIAAHDPIAAFVSVSDETLAQLCYTSGSTGKPKAVPYLHGGLDRFLHSFAEMLPDRETRTTSLVCVPPTAFVSRLVTLRVLANNRYVLLPQFEPERGLAAIERYRVQHISLLPTMAEQLIACSARHRVDCSSLRSINIGGSHVPSALVAGLKKLGPLRVAVQYGMTEAGGGIAMTFDGGDGVVGRVLPGVVVRIGKSDGTQAPPGEVGEIIARTPFAPAGYWCDPEQSASVFRGGFVHTGDLGYIREDGQLCLVGRAKDMIIQGGVNIYPPELIKVIYAIPGVRQCAVIGCPNQVLGEEVVACVVAAEGTEISESQIRAECRRRLDPGKQPVRILFFHALPEKDGGKVDLEALKRQVSARRLAEEPVRLVSQDEVCTLVERTLQSILFDTALAHDLAVRLDPCAPFGELGLTSQGAVRLAHALQEQTGVVVPPTLAYSCPTIDACTEWLLSSRNAERRAVVPKTSPLQSSVEESIAIVGIGVRLPGGVGTPDELWNLLWNGEETVSEVPVERRVNKALPWRAAYLPEVAQFDAAFFRLTAEAAEIDPRHRHLLEVCWEALEDSGVDPTGLPAERTGVFLGLSGERYPTPDPLGRAIGMAAGRMCHFFDIRGPVLTLDTTCSSSLVALHHAVKSLRRRECDLGIVGSANLLAEPCGGDPLGVMSTDGITRAFDAAASGFGQGEGSLVLILKRLGDAVSAGDRIYARVLGGAINHDGRSSSLTAPNPQSQACVIRLACEDAGVAPESVQYVEAHGTGTLLGDPIEVDALVASLGSQRDTPLALGSVKSNIGHLEAAAGLAGVAKVALAIWRRRLPATRHCENPNPRIPWAQVPVRIQASPGEWPDARRPLIAGVSSFGLSGTNAHAVLADAPRDGESGHTNECGLLPISAVTEPALRASVHRWIRALECGEVGQNMRDVAYTACCRRAHLSFRVAVVGNSKQEWAAGLRAQVGRGTALARPITREPRKLALVFSGQGSQWNGMARQLFAQEPVFRDALLDCSRSIEACTGWRVIDELHREDTDSRLGETEVTQPVLFAIQMALHELWRSWGVQASAVVGHSVGEIAAACAAGILTLEEAAGVVCERARLCSRAPRGVMFAVTVSATEAQEHCARLPAGFEIAASNGPRSVVLSGPIAAAMKAQEALEAQGLRVVKLASQHAFHSRLMQGAATALRTAIADPPAREPRMRLISGMTAVPLARVNGDYWSQQLLEPVRFSDAVRALLAEGYSAFLEVGPHPVLLPMIHETLEEQGRADDAIAVGSLRRGAEGVDCLLESLGQLYCANVAVDWRRRFEARGKHVDLPRYSWQHQHYWHDRASSPSVVTSQSSGVTSIAISRASLQDVLEGLTEELVGSLPEDCSLQAIGIDSLGLIRLRSRLASHAGRSVNPPTLRTTLGELIRALAGEDLPSSSPLCWLRPVGEEPTHVWIHPAGGGVDCYRRLAAALPFRSIAIDASARSADDSAFVSVEELAANYMDLLQREGVTGSLILAGWSFGGVIAYEMATQFAHRGRPVEQVVLVDSYAGGDLPLQLQRRPTPAGVQPIDVERLARVQDVHLAALRQYRPRRYEGPVSLLRAVPASGDPDRSWHEAAPALRVCQLAADHFSVMGAMSVSAFSELAGFTLESA